MAFDVVLQTNTSEDTRLDKTLTEIATVSGTLKNECSILTPTIIIEGNPSTLAVCNYFTVSVFGRAYFVTDVRSIRTGIVELSGRVDVLTSFASQIRACRGVVYRNQNLWNTYLDDGSFKVYQNPLVITKAFPQSFGTPEYVLAVAGR